jgi:hypothetical protein
VASQAASTLIICSFLVMLSLKNKNQKVYYFSLRTKVCEGKSVIFILAIFPEYLFA